MSLQQVSLALDSSTLSLETGKIARQADGAVLVRQGDTIVLVTAVYNQSASSSPFFSYDVVPLTVDYREKMYAAGKIPGGFFKREGRPTEKEILSARLVDRPIRPLFPHGFQHDIQVIANVLSSDGEHDPDVLAVYGGATALRLSSLPYPKQGLAAIRVGQVEGRLVANPTYQQLEQSPIDLVVAGTREGVLSLEAGFKEVPEQQVLEAIRFGYDYVLKLIDLQEQLVGAAAKPKAKSVLIKMPSEQLLNALRSRVAGKLVAIHRLEKKEERNDTRDQLVTSLVQELAPEGGATTKSDVMAALDIVEREAIRKEMLDSGKRIDGRSYTELRDIRCEVGVLPRTHGSGLFTRGETQSLGVVTLGTSDDEQMIEALEGQSYKRFMLHYNFPPFSVGEARPIRGTGRREIGHGALAERALLPMLPSKDEFPYTIRVVSEILESNGSSSMASVCSGALSLMDAGVPIKSPVTGVAMGLVKDGNRHAILTDIRGLEDHIGDMDFKVTGTRLGVTALQVDVKLPEGLTLDLINKILAQAHPARMAVMDKVTAAIDKPRPSISPYAPRIITLKINPEKIRDVIGPGGRVIRKIIEETKTKIDIEDDGRVSIASTDGAASDRAVEIIRGLTEDVEVGRLYNARVKRITNFGAFCEILPGKEGLVHVSELAEKYVKNVEDVVKVGDEIRVKVIEVDEQGRLNLSRKRALPDASSSTSSPTPSAS